MTTRGTTIFPRRPAYILSVLSILLASALAAPAASAADDASAFVAGLGRHAIDIMKDRATSTADRQRRFRTLMAEDFDLPKIAQYVLGSYWRNASEAERQQFTTAFGDYMTSLYSIRFGEFNVQSFRVTALHATSGTTTVVRSEIIRLATGEEIDLDWTVVKTPDSYKVIDITAGGASLSQAQRAEFSSVVQRNGESVPNLIRQLQMKSVELATWGP